MASEMMDGFIAGKMDSNNGGNCCYPMMPMWGMPYGMMGMGGMGGWGMGGMWEWFPMLIIAGLLFGNGFGFGGGFGGGGAAMLNGIATRADINEGFALQNITGGIQGIQQGICDATYNLSSTMTNGFHGVDNAICTLGYQNQQGFNSLGHQISDCCCATQRAIDGVNFATSKGLCDLGNAINTQTRDIIDNQNANYRSIMDYLTNDKISTLTAENQALKFAASQSAQNAYLTATMDANKAEILRRSGHDCPTAAYLVQPPTPVNFPLNGCGTVQFGGNYGGCGCGCAA